MLGLASWSLLLDQMVPTPQMLTAARASRAIALSFFAIPTSQWVLTCVRASVALTILQVKNSVPWRVFLYVLTGSQVIFCVGVTVFWFRVCDPLPEWWNIEHPAISTARCVDSRVVRIVTITGASLNIIGDVLLSLCPVTFLWALNRPVVERVLVCLLMGVGSLASIASILKLVVLLRWSRQPENDDLWAMAISACTWNTIEQLVAIVAGCLPFLKPILHRVLSAHGVAMTVSDSIAMTWYKGRSDGTSRSGRSGALPWRRKPDTAAATRPGSSQRDDAASDAERGRVLGDAVSEQGSCSILVPPGRCAV